MNADERDQFAERLLDRTLARYSDAEPRSGLESRILANLDTATQPRRRGSRVLAPVACAAVIAIAIGFAALRHSHSAAPAVALSIPPRTESVTARPAATVASSPQKCVKAEVSTRRIRPRRDVVREPRRPQFPAPEPPTEQERLLAAYLNVTPTHELLAVAADQQAWREQLQKNAEAAAQEPAQNREINHLQVSPLEGGSTEAGAFGNR